MKLSVLMITYNHEKFIAQALESVLTQEVNSDFEIVIGEDSSTDLTRAIVEQYAASYPDKIRLLPQCENLGMMENFIRTFKECSGEYIAILEGDDYWTDPHKLQSQIDILDGSENYAICFHNMEIICDYDPCLNRISNPDQQVITTINDLALGNYIYTASCMFRNNLRGVLPDWITNMPVADYILHLLNAQFGNIYFIENVMGTYRIHHGGIWESKGQAFRTLNWIKLLDAISDKFTDKVNELLQQQKYTVLESNLSCVDHFNFINSNYFTLSVPRPNYLKTHLKRIIKYT